MQTKKSTEQEKSQLYSQVQRSRTTGPVPSGNVEEKELTLEKKWESKRKIPCVYLSVPTKRAIQRLHDEFQIENIKKNYGHANVQASDTFVMRMRMKKWLTKRKRFRIFFWHTANAGQLRGQGRISTSFLKCSWREPQTCIHAWVLLFPCLPVRGHCFAPSTASPRLRPPTFFPIQNITNQVECGLLISHRLKTREERGETLNCPSEEEWR